MIDNLFHIFRLSKKGGKKIIPLVTKVTMMEEQMKQNKDGKRNLKSRSLQ
jgi:hypothetical protein